MRTEAQPTTGTDQPLVAAALTDAELVDLLDDLRLDAADLRDHYESLAAAIEDVAAIDGRAAPAQSSANGGAGRAFIGRAARRNPFRRH